MTNDNINYYKFIDKLFHCQSRYPWIFKQFNYLLQSFITLLPHVFSLFHKRYTMPHKYSHLLLWNYQAVNLNLTKQLCKFTIEISMLALISENILNSKFSSPRIKCSPIKLLIYLELNPFVLKVNNSCDDV